jgi:hypothetical protein
VYRALVVPGKGGRFGSLANPGSFKTEHRDEPFRAKSLIPRFQEKLLSFSSRRPYRKPTQVGRMRILRRLRELG